MFYLHNKTMAFVCQGENEFFGKDSVYAALSLPFVSIWSRLERIIPCMPLCACMQFHCELESLQFSAFSMVVERPCDLVPVILLLW